MTDDNEIRLQCMKVAVDITSMKEVSSRKDTSGIIKDAEAI